MLFGKRKQVVKRILIVEDEPLTAFDNENMLGDAGYEVVATVDDLDEALAVLEREEIHLILSDVRLRKDQTGIELARAAKAKGVPTLFATGHSYPGAVGNRGRLRDEALHRAPAVQGDRMRRPPPSGRESEAAQRRRTVHCHRRSRVARRAAFIAGARQPVKPV